MNNFSLMTQNQLTILAKYIIQKVKKNFYKIFFDKLF